MADNKKENTESPAAATSTAHGSATHAQVAAPTQNQASEPQKSPAELAREKHLQELHDNRFEKKGARRVFHSVNFLGLHQLFNNTASVVITFVLATTNLADKMKDSMANGPIGKSLSAVLTAPSKAVNFAFKICGMDFNKEVNALSPELKKNKLAAIAHEANRNAIQTAFMTIAGFIALMPVYILERNRAKFLNWADSLLHPGRTPEEKKAAALTVEDEPKETLWNLFRARIIALVAVFGIDQIRTNFDRILREKHNNQNKPGMYKSVESVIGWRFGDWIYNHIGEKPRNWIARFFSGKMSGENIALGKIQHETRGDILKLTGAPEFVREASERIATLGEEIRKNHGNDTVIKGLESQIKAIDHEVKAAGHLKAVERAVFAEQSRLFFTKEFTLTTILSAIIYYCAKSPTALKCMEKVGLAKKGTYEKEHAKLEARRHAKQHTAAPETAPASSGQEELSEKRWSGREENQPRAKAAAPAASFKEAVAQNPQEAAVSL